MGKFSALVFLAGVSWLLGSACGPGTGNVAEFQAKDLSTDEPVSLVELRGQPALLTTWAVWCTECRDELPELEAFWQEQGDEFQVVAVNVDGASGPAQRMAKQFSLTMPLWHSTQSSFSKAFETFGVPSSVLVDADGHVVHRFFGPIDFDSDEFEGLVQDLLTKSNREATEVSS